MPAGVIGGVVGYNKGLLISCYHTGIEYNLEPTESSTYHTFAGIGKYDPNNSFAFSCYFNGDIDPDKIDYASLTPGRLCYPATTELMQSYDFVHSDTDLPVNESFHGAKWYMAHYSLNKAADVFLEKLIDGDIPSTAANSSHKQWMLQNGSTYKFTYYPEAYPRIN